MRYSLLGSLAAATCVAALLAACSKGVPIIDDIDGAAFAPDAHSDATVGPPADASTLDQQAPSDSAVDLPDSAQAPDTSTPCKAVALGDGGFDASACAVSNNNSVCAPSSVKQYVPAWIAPTGGHQNLCTAAQLTKMYKDCFDPLLATNATCQSFQNNNAACMQCALSSESDPKWGPIVDHVSYVSVNLSGCIAVAESCNLPCAKAVAAAEGCERASCNSVNCPIVDQASFTSWNTCLKNAGGCLCKGYADVSACQSALADGGTAATVCNAADFPTLFGQVGLLFCGP